MSKCHYSFGRGRRPKGPTFARGTIRSLLKDLELADNVRHMTTRRAHPAVTFFGKLISRSFSLFRQSVNFSFIVSGFNFLFIVSLSVSFAFHFRFSFVQSFLSRFSFLSFHCRALVPAILGRLEQHTLAPKFKAEVALRLYV
jgi:hypothetical protein